MEITREFLEERLKTFSAELERLQGQMNHTAGMRDACFALLEKLDEKPKEDPKE